MAATTANGAKDKKTYVYVPPAPPSELIDCTTFVLSFEDRKFFNIGIDPANKFDIVSHIVTASRHVVLTLDEMNTFFSNVGDILSTLREPVSRTNRYFNNLKYVKISNTIYRGENTIVINSKIEEGCRVLLNTKDVVKLQSLETAVIQLLTYKNSITRPLVLLQFEEFVDIFKTKFKTSRPEEMIDTVMYNSGVQISKCEPSFSSQLRILAARQIVERWCNEVNDLMFKKIIIIILVLYRYFFIFYFLFSTDERPRRST